MISLSGIDDRAAASGRIIKEDNTVVNRADMLEAIYNALVVNKDAGVAITGSLANLAAKKPAASASNIGWTYWSVDTDPHADAVEVSTGTAWEVI